MDKAAPRYELTVSEVTRQVKQCIEDDPQLSGVWVRGEASNVRLHSSGHLYFTLKDERSQLAAAYFRFGAKRRAPSDGEQLLVHGDIRVYEPRGQYQLIADDLLKVGVGDLAAKYEALKARLAEEGLFAPERKVPLPSIPRRIALITSVSTAALQDVLNVLGRRAPYLHAVLFPSSVQGDAAPTELIAALQAADNCPGIEVILLVRGGGSLEDLWCFNDERLARSLATINRPVITGIGHEIDFTIADFVADRRAPTPSAAAELVAPDAAELSAALRDRAGRLLLANQRVLRDAQEDLARLIDRRVLRDVRGQIDTRSQAVDSTSQRLAAAAARAAMLEGERDLSDYVHYFTVPLARWIADTAHLLPRLTADLLRACRISFDGLTARLEAKRHEMLARDPRAPKKLGFALVWQADGKLVRDEETVGRGESLRVELQRGEMNVERK